jgi:hypothetical protein
MQMRRQSKDLYSWLKVESKHSALHPKLKEELMQ